MSWELEYYDWSQLRSSGGAVGVPAAIRDLEAADSEAAALSAYWRIDNTVVVQGAVYEAALPTVRCLLATLQRSTAIARPHILELLVQIGSGEVALPDAADSDLIDRCRVEIARGSPIYMHILECSVSANEQACCVDLLGLCCRADSTLRQRVSWYFGRAKRSSPSEGLFRLLESWEEELGASA